MDFIFPSFLLSSLLAPAISIRLSSLIVVEVHSRMAFIRRLSRRILAALLLSRLPVAACFGNKIKFTNQSHINDVTVWFTMFTLCLAPLVSHIALGLPKTVVMES